MDDDGWVRTVNGLLVTPQEVQTAIHMSKLVDLSIEEANDYAKHHRLAGLPAFHKIQVSKIGGQRFLIATASEPKAVYIAFNAADATATLFKGLDSYQFEELPEGSFHRGLYEKTCALPVDFLSLADVTLAETRVIFCGHSGGGSIAHLYLLTLLLGLNDAGAATSSSERSNLVSIAFGAPLFLNASIAERIKDHDLENHLITFVNRSDPVPLLFHHLPALKDPKLPASLEADVVSLTSGILALLGVAASVIAAVYGLPVIPVPFKTLQGLWKKLSNWLTAAEGTSGASAQQRSSDSTYVPAGVYVYLKMETPQNFSAGLVKRGSDDYGQTHASLEALGDHRLSAYMMSLDKTEAYKLRPERLVPPIPTVMYFATRVTGAFLWPAQQQGAAYITVKGSNLAGTLRGGCQLSSLSRDMLGEWVPRYGGGELRLVQADPTRGMRISKSFGSLTEFQGLRIKIRTCYTEHEVEVQEREANGFHSSLKASLGASLQNIALRRCFGVGRTGDEVEIALLTELVAVTREEIGAGSAPQPASVYETISAAARPKVGPGAAPKGDESRPLDALQAIVATLEGLAPGLDGDAARGTRARAERLKAALERLEAAKCQILAPIEAPLMIEVPKSRYVRAARAAVTPIAAVAGLVVGAVVIPFAMLSALIAPEFNDVGVVGRLGGLVFSPIVAPIGAAVGLGMLAAGSSTRLVVIPTSDVLGFLQNFLSSEAICLDPKKATARDIAELAEKGAFRSRSVEDLLQWINGAGKGKKVPGGLTSIIRRIKAIALIVALEDLVKDTVFVGVCGPENSGKSTFVKSWGDKIRRRAGLPQMVDVPDIGNKQHTRLVSAYQVLDQLWVVDFPGNNGLDEDSRNVWRRFSSLSSLCVYMIDFSPGDLNEDQLQGIRQLRENSERPVHSLVLVNRVDIPFYSTQNEYSQAFFQAVRERLALEFDCSSKDVLITQLGGSPAALQSYETLGLKSMGVVRLEDVCVELRNKLLAIHNDPERSSPNFEHL